MSLYYTVFVNDTQPTKGQPNWFWVKPVSSEAYVYILSEWKLIATGGAIASYTEGIFWYEAAVQETAPTTKIGKIWIKESAGEAKIYLDTWTLFYSVV